MSAEQSLFDLDETELDEPSADEPSADEPSAPARVWTEVPAAVFLSWSDMRQRDYCRRRDLDSAANAESEWWAEFYLERAKAYDAKAYES